MDNPSTCLKCKSGYLAFGEECVTTCPIGSVMTFGGKNCRRLTDVDARLVYFPFLICLALISLISWVGRLVKPNHLVLTNFLIILGFLEHIALVVQLILTFIFGTYLLAIAIIIIWIGYIVSLIVFNFFWRRDVINTDFKYNAYRTQSENITSTKVITFLSIFVSWRFNKLLYSHFFGIKVNSFTFSDGKLVGTTYV